jgi:hypothetical protein
MEETKPKQLTIPLDYKNIVLACLVIAVVGLGVWLSIVQSRLQALKSTQEEKVIVVGEQRLTVREATQAIVNTLTQAQQQPAQPPQPEPEPQPGPSPTPPQKTP